VKFGWRESATSATGSVDPAFDDEVDQEFEDACLALAMSDVPKSAQGEPPASTFVVPELEPETATFTPPIAPPVRESATESAVPPPPLPRAFAVATAAELAEDLPEEPAEITAQDLAPIRDVPRTSFTPPIPPIPAVPAAVVPDPVLPAAGTSREPAESGAALAAAQAELAATKIELESLRADFQAERFRSRDERLRLEDELASVRQTTAVSTAGLTDDDEVLALQREVDVLRGELVSLRSRHAEEIARLEADVKAAHAREAQTVIAAQLAEDELKAVRATLGQQESGLADLEVTARDLSASRAEVNTLRQMISELQASDSDRVADWEADRRALKAELGALEARLADKDNDLRVARESAADRVTKVESQLAAKEAELAVTQQELLDAEMRRAEEAASFLAALHKQD
jgi:hypothetical protein